MKHLVSIITSSFNCAEYLPACIRSVLAQTHQNWEHLVVDCGSSDDTQQVLRSLQHDRLKIFSRGKMPVTAARNLLLREAKGEFVAILDADDTCMVDRLELQLALLRAHPELDAVGAWVRLWYPQTGNRKETRFPVRRAEISRLYAAGVNIIPHSTLMARRASVDRLGGYDQRLAKAEDYDLILQLSRAGGVEAIPKHLVEYCMRSQDAPLVFKQESMALNRVYVAFSLLQRAHLIGALPELPLRYDDIVSQRLLLTASEKIRKNCVSNLFSANFRIGLRCRLLLAVRLLQILRRGY